ncbi:S-layer homology domain-containing protein [Cohnella hashimotonis]|uniref:S-layer homology domain-containing protein n=1 Tax=Cohnella hashimotonis TaxID=2826895 RepID=A0ABT6TMJ6_9BACL|nr:S-layer homology domain-containing protein [Cohnella hashimotonis]
MNKQHGARWSKAWRDRRWLAFLSSLALVLSLFSSAGGSAYADSGMSGQGTAESPWKVTNSFNLGLIGSSNYPLSGYYILKNDIALTEAWTPIGFNSDNGFTGTFDGNGHTISGLSIDRPTEDNIGLFSQITNGAVYNLTIETDPASGVVGKNNVGLLAGAIAQTNSNKQVWVSLIKATGNVTGNRNVGGLVGYAEAANSFYAIFAYNQMGAGVVTGARSVGGLVGLSDKTQVYNSSSAASVGSGEGMGGLIGSATGTRVTRSYATGAVTSLGGSNVGGLIGASNGNDIQMNYATGDVTGSVVGGLLGFSGEDKILHNYSAGNIVTTGLTHGLIGDNFQSTSTVVASYWDTSTSGVPDAGESDAAQYGIGRSTFELQEKATFTSAQESNKKWDFEHYWFMQADGYPQLYGGMDLKLDVDPSAVSDQISHSHELTVNANSGYVVYGQTATVYRAADDENVGTFGPGESAPIPVTVDTTGAIEGKKRLDDGYYLVDQDGRRTSVFYPEVLVDNTPPAWENGASITPSENGGNVNLSWDGAVDGTGSGVAYYNLYVNGTATQVYETTTIVSNPPANAVYEVEAVDKAGNKSAKLSFGGTPSTTTISGLKNITFGQIDGYYLSYVTGAPSSSGIGSQSYGGTQSFYIDGVLQKKDVQLGTIMGAYSTFSFKVGDFSEGVHTLKAVYSGYVGKFDGIDYAVSGSEGTLEITISGLKVDASDPSGAANNGKTKLTVTPAPAPGHKLVYRNFGSGDVTVPVVGEALDLAEYAELPESGLIAAANGDHIGVVEIDAATENVVHFGQGIAVSTDETEGPGPVPASGLTVVSSDPSGAENDGKTRLAVTPEPESVNKLVYYNFGSGNVTVPNVGETLNLSEYADLPEDGLIAAANGDNVGVAEIDAAGAVVRFGQTTAVASDESEGPGPVPAAGLTVVSNDPSGAENDGKTRLTVTPEPMSVNKLVYYNFGSGSVNVPNVGDALNLSEYSDLPANGLIAAANGDKVGVAEIDAAGAVVRFGQTTAVVVKEDDGYVPPIDVPSNPVPTDEVEVLVNGKVEKLGKAKTAETGGVKTTTVTVDAARLQAKLDAEGSHAVVTIPVAGESSQKIGQLTGQLVKNMENASATLVLRTDNASYTIPAKEFNIDALSGKLGQALKLEDIQVQIEIAEPSADTIAAAQRAAANGEFTLAVPPVSFTVRASYGTESVEVTRFNAYIERTIAIPDGVDASKITTGVVIDQDGTTRHVPTQVVVIDGRYYAKINSLTNSTYAVVSHEMAFTDTMNHWAKDAVEDMGSRMVVEGTGGGLFSPDREVTRAEFAAIVVRGLGLKPESGDSSFSDVAAGDWHGAAIATASAYGLIDGFADGTFRPNDKLTREQAMVIVSKALTITGLQGKLSIPSADAALRPFKDAAAVSAWAQEGVAASVTAGIATGRGDAKLAPKEAVTRAEVAALVQRLLQKSGLI